ncbi:MAG TPA: DMT family transporter [Xanthobacteraceae bacterium]|jgi:drug/metabolite transporter (DMT)-like permease|nr:DMT family transporter [Xanthobacteraceae bacterium]
MYPLAPGILAGISLGVSDALAKLIFAAGSDVLTLLSFRSVIGLIFIASWLSFGPRPKADRRIKLISLGVGILFTGLIFCLFKAIAAVDVSTAILSYFTYPLLTGLSASALGLEPLRLKGLLCALAAFVGLGIMIGAHPAGLAFAGVAYAVGAACCRTAVLLVTRAYLVGGDARLTTWYSMLSSTVIFLAVSTAQRDWQPPQTNLGWICLVFMSLATTAAILFVFVSTMRIGPFRTALIMNLEPLTATLLSTLVLGDVLTSFQAAGCGVMLAALVAFQLWR